MTGGLTVRTARGNQRAHKRDWIVRVDGEIHLFSESAWAILSLPSAPVSDERAKRADGSKAWQSNLADALDFLETSATIKDNAFNVPEIKSHNAKIARFAELIRPHVFAASCAAPVSKPKRWYLACQNDGLFIINAEPRPSNDDQWHDRPDGPSVVLNVTELPEAKAIKIVGVMNDVSAAPVSGRDAVIEDKHG